MNRNDERAQNSTSREPAQNNKRAWERPELVRMGHLKEFVQGGGKGGSNADGDPQSSGKNGMG